MIDDSRRFGATAPRVLLLAGSPQATSRSAALLDAVAQRLDGDVLQLDRLAARDLPPAALVHADFGDADLAAATARVALADAVVIATPVYKAAYSGVLKAFLDVLPQAGLRGKVVLPLATGGSPHHMLALDYALRPVLQSLGARLILPGVYATDAQVVLTPDGAHTLAPELAARLDDAVAALATEGLRLPAASAFEPVHIRDVRCSV